VFPAFCSYVYMCAKGQLLSECPLQSPPVEGEWPVVVRSLLSSNMRPHFKIRKSLGKNKNMVMGPDVIRNWDWLCWRRSAAIYPTDGRMVSNSASYSRSVGFESTPENVYIDWCFLVSPDSSAKCWENTPNRPQLLVEKHCFGTWWPYWKWDDWV
jgi:hypothetical protein